MSDLRNILKEEYKKKEEVVTPQSLIEMIEEVMSKVSFNLSEIAPPTGGIEMDPSKGTQEDVSIALPFVQLSEAWGKPGSMQRGEIDAFVAQLGGGGPGIGTLRTRLQGLADFVDTYLGDVEKFEGGSEPISKVISSILILDTLSAIVTAGEEEQFSASPAGFLFEGFLAALAGGNSSQVKPSESKSTEDITIDIGDEGGVPVSLKLLRRAGGEVHGSIEELAVSFGVSPEELQQRINVAKGSVSEVKAKVGTKLPIDPETGKPVAPTDTAFAGMKYIIVLKTKKGKEGTLLEFYEWDFSIDNFVEFVKTNRIKWGSATQFTIPKSVYLAYSQPLIKGEGYVLPTSSRIRASAAAVLEKLYKDFYEILVTLKKTTDSLNLYLSNPEEQKSSGKIAAREAGTLEREITQTTD